MRLIRRIDEETEMEGILEQIKIPSLTKAGMNLAASLMHQRSGNVSEALASMLDDSSSAGAQRSDQVFQFISELSQSLTGTGLVELHNVVLSELQRLVDLDRRKCSALILDMFPNEHERVLAACEDPWMQYSYLQEVVLSGEMGSIPADIQTLYVKLMCQFDKKHVYSYLVGTENYPLGECLQLCRRYTVSDAEAYLLERMGDIDGALKLLLSLQLEAVDSVVSASVASSQAAKNTSPRQSRRRSSSAAGEIRSLPSWQRAYDLLQCIISLCERSSEDGGEAAACWLFWYKC